MTSSILNTIKKMVGIDAEYRHFDTDLIVHINTTFMTLTQIGVGPKEGFYINDEFKTWDEFLNYQTITESNSLIQNSIEERTRKTLFEAVKTYMYLKVRLLFDPPTGTGLLEAMKEQAKELEWRLQHQAEYSAKEE